MTAFTAGTGMGVCDCVLEQYGKRYLWFESISLRQLSL
jgi:hypothetical protein